MAHARHISTAQALYRVFIQPSISASALRTASAPPLRPVLATIPSFAALPAQRRTAVKYRPPVERKTPYDEEIGSRLINLVDSEGVFQPGVRLDHTLQSFDRATHHLVQMGVAPEGSEYPYPVCKVIDKTTLREQERTKAKQQAKKSAVDLTKTIELNWAVSANDLTHWLKRLREFLEDGRRVEVVLGPKKRGRKATTEEAREVLESVKATVEEVEGAKERAPADGEFGGILTLFYEGPEKPKEKEEKGEKKKKEKKEKKEDGDENKVSRWKIKEEERRRRAEEERMKQEAERRQEEKRNNIIRYRASRG